MIQPYDIYAPWVKYILCKFDIQVLELLLFVKALHRMLFAAWLLTQVDFTLDEIPTSFGKALTSSATFVKSVQFSKFTNAAKL